MPSISSEPVKKRAKKILTTAATANGIVNRKAYLDRLITTYTGSTAHTASGIMLWANPETVDKLIAEEKLNEGPLLRELIQYVMGHGSVGYNKVHMAANKFRDRMNKFVKSKGLQASTLLSHAQDAIAFDRDLTEAKAKEIVAKFKADIQALGTPICTV